MSKFKSMLKSTGFRSVVVLLVICLVSVGLLAVLNDLLYVSDDVRFERAMKKIYDKEGVTFQKTSVNSAFSSNSAYGSVSSVTYAVRNGVNIAAVIEAKGTESTFGDITCYVVISSEGFIEAWMALPNASIFKSSDANAINSAYIGQDVSNEISFNSSTMNIAGMTVSSGGILRAINMAGYYSRNALGFGKNPQAEALAELQDLLVGTELEGATFTSPSVSGFNHLKNDTNSLAFVFTTDKDNNTYYAFAYKVGGADTNEFIVINASYNDTVRSTVIAQTDGIGQDVVDLVTTNYFNRQARITDVLVNGTQSTYTVLGYAYDHAPQITLTVVIENGAIASITASGSIVSSDWDPSMVLDINRYNGVTIDQINSVQVGGGGATESDTVISNAVKTALTHYDANHGEVE